MRNGHCVEAVAAELLMLVAASCSFSLCTAALNAPPTPSGWVDAVEVQRLENLNDDVAGLWKRAAWLAFRHPLDDPEMEQKIRACAALV